MINRRFMIVPPALLSGGHAEQLEQTSKDFPCLLLEMANMRVPRIVEARHAKYVMAVPGPDPGIDPAICRHTRWPGHARP
jgi:hypothetical protein